jgi:hypothetical protein
MIHELLCLAREHWRVRDERVHVTNMRKGKSQKHEQNGCRMSHYLLIDP